MPKSEIRVLVLGDGKCHIEKVGKTSIIKALSTDTPISEIPSSQIPSVSPPVIFRPEDCLGETSVTIVDTFYRRDLPSEGNIEEELTRADVVMLMYDISRPETMDRLAFFWLPLINQHTRVPVAIVGNKVDLKQTTGNGTDQYEELMRPLLRDFKQCEVFIECSAKTLLNLPEVYYHIQRVVLYPTEPLYDHDTRELTPKFEKALTLIFRLVDKDKDFLLSDRELAEVHSVVYNIQLNSSDIDRIKEVLRQQCEEGVTEAGINLHGFYHLLKMTIQRIKINVCWNMLKYFGFNDDLELSVHYEIDKKSGQSVELSRQAIEFLVEMFNQYSHQGVLTYEDLREIFATVFSPPWAPNRRDEQAWLNIDKHVETTADAGLTIQSWLALWHLLTLLDYKNSLKYLVYIGYNLPLDSALQVTRSRDKDILGVVRRKVYCGFVIGYPGVGKSTFLDSFIRKEFNTKQTPSSSSRAVCCMLDEAQFPWDCRYLTLIEYPYVEIKQMWQNIEACDVMVLISDASSEADRYINTEFKVPDKLPKVLIHTKSQNNALNMCCDLEDARPDPLFFHILEVASHPWKGLEDQTRVKLTDDRNAKRWYRLKTAGLAALGVLVGIVIIKRLIR